MGDDTWLEIREGRLAIHSGSRRSTSDLARRSVVNPSEALVTGSGSGCCYVPARYWVGSTGVAPLRISKCNCGEVTVPVCPERAMTLPRLTVSPRRTISSLALAYAVTKPFW